MSVKLKEKAAAAPEAPAAKKPQFSVMLGNKCQRYLIPAKDGGKDRLFLAGKEYPVTQKEREELFQLADDFGVRFFYDAKFIKEREARKLASMNRARHRDGQGEAEQSERELTDEEGNPIGNAGSIDTVDSDVEVLEV